MVAPLNSDIVILDIEGESNEKEIESTWEYVKNFFFKG